MVELDKRSPGRNGVGRDTNSDCQGAKTSRSFRSFRSDLNDLTDLADLDLGKLRNFWSNESINKVFQNSHRATQTSSSALIPPLLQVILDTRGTR